MITCDDIGHYFVRKDKDGVWRCIMYCEHPTAIMENVVTKERIVGAASSPLLDEFQRLASEEKV